MKAQRDLIRAAYIELIPEEAFKPHCDKHGLQPMVFYRWQKEFFENGSAAFQPKARPNRCAEQERIE